MNNAFEQVTIPYRKGEIIIQEVPAAFGLEQHEINEKKRKDGVPEYIISTEWVAAWCAESVVSESGMDPLSEDDKKNIRQIRPKKWFDVVWSEVDKLNMLTPAVKEDVEKNSDEVEDMNSTSTDSAETLDIQA